MFRVELIGIKMLMTLIFFEWGPNMILDRVDALSSLRQLLFFTLCSFLIKEWINLFRIHLAIGYRTHSTNRCLQRDFWFDDFLQESCVTLFTNPNLLVLSFVNIMQIFLPAQRDSLLCNIRLFMSQRFEIGDFRLISLQLTD